VLRARRRLEQITLLPLAAPRAPSRMDGAHAAAAAASEAGGSSSSASSASSYGGSESRFKGWHLRRRRRRRVADRGGEGSNKGGDGDGIVQDLALPLGMSFAAVLAQVSGVLDLFLCPATQKIQFSRSSCRLRSCLFVPTLGGHCIRLGVVRLHGLLV
jgi:hypothetical protein